MWYRKVFKLPSHWEGSRVLLHFGAVDWQCQAYINGHDVGVHTGGYDKVRCRRIGKVLALKDEPRLLLTSA